MFLCVSLHLGDKLCLPYGNPFNTLKECEQAIKPDPDYKNGTFYCKKVKK